MWASIRGPRAEGDTPAGSSARAALPQTGQARRCFQCSNTSGAIAGSSHFWWTSGSPRLCSLPSKVPRALARQVLKAPIDLLGARQLAGLALVTRLAALLSKRFLGPPAGLSPALLAGHRRIHRRWRGAVARALAQPALELRDPLLRRADHRRHRNRSLRAECLNLIASHTRKIPCNQQEPCSRSRHALNAYPPAGDVDAIGGTLT